MKILLANSFFFLGAGDITYTLSLAELLRSHGHEVAFFAMQDPRNMPDPNSDLFVSHIDFRALNERKSLAGGARVLFRTVYSTEARQKFSRLLDRFQPDIVHLQNIHGHISPSILFEAQRRHLPVFWTLHDYRIICPNSHLLIDRTASICEACRGGRFYHASLARCKKNSLLASSVAAFEGYVHHWLRIPSKVEAFLTPSAFLRQKLVQNGFAEDRVVHLPLFLRPEYFRKNDEDRGYLMFLGRLEVIKGIKVLAEAARQAPGVHLLIVGPASGALANQLPGLLPGNASYLGPRYGQELEDLTRGALGIVVPSIWYENQPFSILEAFAAGKPVITSNLGGMAELVAHGERGLLVEPGNPVELAEAMSQMVSDPLRAKAMGENARAFAIANHSPELHYRRLMDVYHRGIGSIPPV